MVASCHLSYLVRTFSDLGSVNITQKERKKKLPLLLCKSRKVEAQQSLTRAPQFPQNQSHLVETGPWGAGPPGSCRRLPQPQPAYLRPGLCPPDKPSRNYSSLITAAGPRL